MRVNDLLARFVQWITFGASGSIPASFHNELDRQSALSSDDIRLFEALCQFLWIQGEPLPLIFDVHDEIYTRQGITLTTLKRLEDAGLVRFERNGFVKKGFRQHARLFYCGKPTKIGFSNNENNELDLGHVLLTERGKALALTYPVSRNQQFYEYVINRWFQQGLVLSSIQIDQNQQSRHE